MSPDLFHAGDLEAFRARGIAGEEAERQLVLLREPPPAMRLERPCAVGDGIETIDHGEVVRLSDLHEQAARQGRCAKFVPASGAATRMFQSLLTVWGWGDDVGRDRTEAAAAAGSVDAERTLHFLDRLEAFPFAEELRAVLAFRGYDLDNLLLGGAVSDILDALLGREGLGYAELPKGLVKFHRSAQDGRTAFEEHLLEAAAYVRDVEGRARVHFTVAAEARAAFEEALERARPAIEKGLGVRLEVSFSIQSPATDTLALDGDGAPLRDARGALLFRPAGHGALLGNLAALLGDVVLVKNIDNVVPDTRKAPTIRWKRVLGGLVVERQREIFLRVARLRSPGIEPWALEEAATFAKARIGWSVPPGLDRDAVRLALLDRLDRPVRVCGVVRNEGEPGGGPFWVRHADGSATRQIVESAQIDPGDEAQREIFRAASHFNPVDLACGMLDAEGKSFDLERFVDPSASIVTRKAVDGREVSVLERPGLWNGAMAGWITFFVEVPSETFAPVKTVLDLLRPEHQ